ncbi:MAG: hypothetical protein OXN94_11390 [Chloroflexota bacterium]|nr:hypothetical protein [Chloroflexota bacterium]
MFQNRPVEPDSISLLWRDRREASAASSQSFGPRDDLRIEVIAEEISPYRDYTRAIRDILSTLLTDIETLAYRHEALDDCLDQPDFTLGLTELLPKIRDLGETVSDIRARRHELALVLSRLTELENYVECVTELDALLQVARPALKACAWHKLEEQMARTAQDPLFQQMAAELPELRERIREIVSVTIGINLSPDLRPVAATLLSINRRRFQGPRFFRKLWGSAGEDEMRGIGPLHRAPSPSGGGIMTTRRETLDRLAGNSVFGDLRVILDDVIRPINRALAAYARVNSRMLRAIENEIAFYVGAARMISKLRGQGLVMCRPTLLPPEERRMDARGMVNLDLALRLSRQHRGEDLGAHIVGNDARFDDEGRIHVLTGPNRGGKTTWMGAIGLLHVLAQSGLYLPAASATLSPVDAICLHFPVEEDPEMESGRLGEEAQRLREIFSRATSHSLILMNESLASTSATESYFLARDVLSCLRILGARAVFVTHLHELAVDCHSINDAVAGDSRVGSLISEVEEDASGLRRTYRVRAAPPRGQSYAREIARQYGISFEQLRTLVEKRPPQSP